LLRHDRPIYLLTAVTFSAVLGCLTGNKGVDAGKPQTTETETSITGNQNRVNNIVLQVGQVAPWVACGLFGVATWRGRRYRQGLDRAIQGIEMCGPACTAKDHMRQRQDAVEKVVHRRVVKLTK